MKINANFMYIYLIIEKTMMMMSNYKNKYTTRCFL